MCKNVKWVTVKFRKPQTLTFSDFSTGKKLNRKAQEIQDLMIHVILCIKLCKN